MTAATQAIMHKSGVALPNKGTLNIAASQTIYPGSIVCRDAAGRAVNPADGDGIPAMGVSSSNATLGSSTVAADAVAVELSYGLFGFKISGTTPLPGQMLYVVDNQTVSTSSAGGTRGKAGPCTEVRDSLAYLWIGPHTGAASTLLGGSVPLPIGAAPAFADGTANGLDPTVFGFRLNNAVDDQPYKIAIAVPDDLDAGADVQVVARAYIIDDATDDDVVMVLVAKFDGGSDVAPVSATILGETAADITFTIPAASVPTGATSLYLELDCAGTLDTSDAVIRSVELKYTKKA